MLVYAAEFGFDPEEYDDPPQNDYREIRKTVESKFPELGFYDPAEYTEELGSVGKICVGDAIDGLTDVVGDLLEIEWYFENTSEADALWHLETSYRDHCGNHLRELQLYLYRQHY